MELSWHFWSASEIKTSSFRVKLQSNVTLEEQKRKKEKKHFFYFLILNRMYFIFIYFLHKDSNIIATVVSFKGSYPIIPRFMWLLDGDSRFSIFISILKISTWNAQLVKVARTLIHTYFLITFIHENKFQMQR